MIALKDLKKALNERAGPCPIVDEPEGSIPVHRLPKELHGLVCMYHAQMEYARGYAFRGGMSSQLAQRYKKLADAIKIIIDECLRSHHGPPSNTGYKLYSGFRYGRVPLEE